MTKKLPLSERLNRRPISRACKFCHQKHLQCDATRPCKNCVKRGVGHECQDVERKRAKYLSDDSKDKQTTKRTTSTTMSSTPSTDGAVAEAKFQPILPNATVDNKTGDLFATYTNPSLRDRMAVASSQSPVFDPISQPKESTSTTPTINRILQNSTRSDSSREFSPPQDVFSSLFANQEYSQLTDILDKSGTGAETPLSTHSGNAAVYNTDFQTSFQNDNNTRPYISLSDNSTQSITQSMPSLILATNDEDYTSPLVIRNMIKIPEDVYTTQIHSYNYPKAYHALLNYLKTRFNKEQLIKIAEFMADYRPSFIAATRSLVEMDLLFAERSFQRSLLEYESMSSLSSSPTIMWRRTGEIVAVSTEFSSLTSHSKGSLLSKRTFIIELMNDSSALDYFKLFSSVAFGDLNGVIITECTLLSPNGEPIRCASTWTVKRDVFDIPMLIVGQFLPILQVR